MNLTTQKRLAASILKVGLNRVWIDPERLEQLGNFLNEASELRLLDENDLTISLDGQNYDIIFGVEEKGFDLKYVDNLNILLKALIN